MAAEAPTQGVLRPRDGGLAADGGAGQRPHTRSQVGHGGLAADGGALNRPHEPQSGGSWYTGC